MNVYGTIGCACLLSSRMRRKRRGRLFANIWCSYLVCTMILNRHVRIMSAGDVTKIVRTGNIHAFSDMQPGPTTLAELEKILQDPGSASAAHIRAQSAGPVRGQSFDDIYRTRRDSAFAQAGGGAASGNNAPFQSRDMLMRKNSAMNSDMLNRKNSGSSQSFRRNSQAFRKSSKTTADMYNCANEPEPIEPLTLVTPEALAQFDRLPPNFGRTLDRILGVPVRQVHACMQLFFIMTNCFLSIQISVG
jgi:hypothetical protein